MAQILSLIFKDKELCPVCNLNYKDTKAEMCIDFFVNKIKPKTNIIKKGYAVRYIADCIIYI